MTNHIKLPIGVIYHPCLDDNGKLVPIYNPSKSTIAETWLDPDAIATVAVQNTLALPEVLNGVKFVPWTDAPKTQLGWADVPGQNVRYDPDMDVPPGMHTSAGVIVEEPDCRVWVVHPTNKFGGYRATFAKGRAEKGVPLQALAIKEAFEEAGLKVVLTCFFGDIVRSTSISRYYWARRVGGMPAAAGWESQAVSLVPKNKLKAFLDQAVDKVMADQIIDSKDHGSKYLGSPTVVTKLVGDFSQAVYEMTKARGSGAMTESEMSVELLALIQTDAEIVMGKNPDYVSIMGWNNRFALGMAIRQYLGVFWDNTKVIYGDDPGKVLFSFLAAHTVEQAVASQNGDPDIAGAKIRNIIDGVIKLLLGLAERV